MQRRGRKGIRGRGRRTTGRVLKHNRQNPIVNPSLQLAKTGCFVPSKFRTSLRIAASLSAAASTTSANVVLSGNNMFDPLLSSGTNRCVGWTHLAALYNRYRVIGSKLQVICTMSTTITTGTAQISGAVAIAPSNTGLGRTLFSDAISQPYAKWADITSSVTKNISIVMPTSKIMGNKTVEATDRTQALISGPPGEEWYWIITYVSDGNYVTSFVVMDVQMTYDVEFFDRNEIDRSTLEGQQQENLHEQIYALRCKQLSEMKKPHNDTLPWNKAKQGVEEKKHLDDISRELKEIDAYQKLHKTFEPTDWKDSVRGPILLDNTTVHEKWLKLREVDDQLPKETPKSRPPSRK